MYIPATMLIIHVGAEKNQVTDIQNVSLTSVGACTCTSGCGGYGDSSGVTTLYGELLCPLKEAHGC